MELKDFEARANALGMVPMLMLRESLPYNEGHIFGFYPAEALERFNAQEAVPVDEDGEPLKDFAGPRATKPAEPEHDPVKDIEIPEDWRDKHHLQVIRLAKAISGSDGALSLPAAEAIIEGELQRRKDDADEQHEA